MTYEETVEVEKSVKVKEKAELLCRQFRNNVTLSMKEYEGNGTFRIWSDSHNKIYVDVGGQHPVFRWSFLNESYDLVINASDLFDKIKSGCKGIDYLAAHVRDGK